MTTSLRGAAQGHSFSPAAWIGVLLRLYPAGVYTETLAALNRAARFREPVAEYQRQFLQRLSPGPRVAVAEAQVERPAIIADSLRQAMDAIMPLLNPVPDPGPRADQVGQLRPTGL